MINLLPPKEKQILLKERQFKEAVILGFIVLTSLSILILILFFIRLDIKNKALWQRQILSQEEAKKSLDVENSENQIKGFNKTISELNNFLKEKYYLTDIFIALSKITPRGLYFTNISYNQEKKEFSMTGFSQKREELLIFKGNLEKETGFQDVYFPASNWLKSENIVFFVRFGITN